MKSLQNPKIIKIGRKSTNFISLDPNWNSLRGKQIAKIVNTEKNSITSVTLNQECKHYKTLQKFIEIDSKGTIFFPDWVNELTAAVVGPVVHRQICNTQQHFLDLERQLQNGGNNFIRSFEISCEYDSWVCCVAFGTEIDQSKGPGAEGSWSTEEAELRSADLKFYYRGYFDFRLIVGFEFRHHSDPLRPVVEQKRRTCLLSKRSVWLPFIIHKGEIKNYKKIPLQ